MTMNLRCDNTFAEDEGWHIAAERYAEFPAAAQGAQHAVSGPRHRKNTPAIVKFPFLALVNEWPDATYACINLGEARCA